MSERNKQCRSKPHLRLIRFIGVIVPRRFRARFRQEWEAELEYREELLARWDRLDWRSKFELLWRSLGAFWDALWLQRQRLEEDMFQDLRFGVRMLMKSPGFGLAAVFSLALGIGANTSVFSLLDALLLKPLPVKQPEQLVIVGTQAPDQPGRVSSSYSYPVFREMREKNSVFSDMFARAGLQMSLSSGGQTERVLGEVVSGNFFSALGVNPLLGRLLTEEDDQTPGGSPVAVISFNFWQRRFGADPQIVGQTISLNSYPFTIIGVAPQGFHGVEVGAAPDVRIPLMMDGHVRPRPANLRARRELVALSHGEAQTRRQRRTGSGRHGHHLSNCARAGRAPQQKRYSRRPEFQSATHSSRFR